MIYIPNAEIIKNSLINYTLDQFSRQKIEVWLNIEYYVKISEIVDTLFIIILGDKNTINDEIHKSEVIIDNITEQGIIIVINYWIDIKALSEKIEVFQIRNHLIITMINALIKKDIIKQS